MDDSIQNAIRIGERNKEIIELAHNWCAHLQMSEKCPTLSVIFAERPQECNCIETVSVT